MSYVLPQVQVFQIFRQLPQNVVKNLNAFVFGPHFQLFRYAESAERLGSQVYDGTALDLSWAELNPVHPAGSIVDTGYTKLFADNLWAEYLAMAAGTAYAGQVTDAAALNKVQFPTLVLKSSVGYPRSGVLLRDVRIGDRVRWTYADDEYNDVTGTSKVVGFEGEDIAAVIAATVADADNAATTTPTDLSTGNTAAFAPGATNSAPFSLSAVHVLNGSYFKGLLSAGVTSDVVTLTVTTPGVAGVARISVAYASGIYGVADVPVLASGINEGEAYIGHGMYVDFIADASEGVSFVEGDTYTVTVSADFTKLDDGDVVQSGTFIGVRDTTYVVSVVRGGLFDRQVSAVAGAQANADATLAVNPGDTVTPDWSVWAGGDRDDEYVLVCTDAGTVATAKFALTSQRGDDQTDIVFGTSGTDIVLGNLGLAASMTLAGATDFEVGDYWVIRVNASRPQVLITDSAGTDTVRTVTVDDDALISLGNLGAKVTFLGNGNTEDGVDADGGLRLGDVYLIGCTAAKTGALKTLVLADSLPAAAVNAALDLSLYLVQSHKEIESKRTQSLTGEYNWTVDADTGVSVGAGIAVQDAEWADAGVMPWLPVSRADLVVQYRTLLTGYADTIHSISDISDVTTLLGTVSPDNPLAAGVHMALSNSGNRAVYFMGLPTNDAAGWAYVLDRATLNEDVYAFVPLTRNMETLHMVEAHINTMSTETEKRWRIGFFSAEMPEYRNIYTAVSNPAGTDYLAKIALDGTTGAYTLLNFVNADGTPSLVTEALEDIRAGDKIRIGFVIDAWGDTAHAEYTVAAVLSNTQLRLVSGPAAAISVASKVEAYHSYTVAEMADAYAAISNGFYNRRIYNVFPSQLGSAGTVYTGEFGAAAVAGLASSVPPQQPLTNIEVNGFDDLPLIYQTFNRTQLNKMAEYGTLILMQDAVGSVIYVRHEVSTKAKYGNLNETELSLIKNFDSISYYFAARFAPYVGRYNVTPALLKILDLILDDGISYLASKTSAGNLGPQLILEETEVEGIQQHPELADHVIATAILGMPKPFNVLQLRLVV